MPLMPVITAWMIDLAIDGGPERMMWLSIYAGILVGLWALNIPAHTLYFSQLSHITRSIGRDLRVRICRQLQTLSLLFHYRTSVGKLHSKAIRDLEIIEQAPFLIFDVMLNFMISVTIAFIAIWLTAPAALLFFLIAVPISAVIRFGFYRILNKRVEQLRSSIETMSGSLNEMLKMIPVTRSHGLEQDAIDRIEPQIEHVYTYGRRFDVTRALFGSSTFATMNILQVLFLAGSIYACFNGYITVGAVVMFNSFFLILSAQLASAMNTLPQIIQARESLHSISEILAAPETEQNSGKNPFGPVKGAFELKDVTFRYPGTDVEALSGISLSVDPGEAIAFVGDSGAGKSTMLSLLLGLILPDSGRVLIDGYDIREMDLRTFRKQVGVVSQDVLMFSGSVYDNVVFGSAEVDEQAVWQALEQAGAAQFVSQLPDGLNTQLGDQGVRLSGGQQQRLSIARAIIRDPQVLILDEATSALDQETEAYVQESLNQIMQNRTTFIVSHRPSAIQNADRVIHLESGRITDAKENHCVLGH